MGLYSINRRASVIGGTGFGGRQQAPLIARGQMFAGYDIPPAEVAELYKLFTQTGGTSWINRTNWFANKTCATWFGLTVAGGRVTAINIGGNNVIGRTGFSLKPFLKLASMSCPASGSVHPESYFGFDLVLSDLPASFVYLSSGYTQIVVSPGTGVMQCGGLYELRVYWPNRAEKPTPDVLIETLYANRMIFTHNAPSARLGDYNLAPTGIYQLADPPTTPYEKLYHLVNDPLGEGFRKWTITVAGPIVYTPPE